MWSIRVIITMTIVSRAFRALLIHNLVRGLMGAPNGACCSQLVGQSTRNYTARSTVIGKVCGELKFNLDTRRLLQRSDADGVRRGAGIIILITTTSRTIIPHSGSDQLSLIEGQQVLVLLGNNNLQNLRILSVGKNSLTSLQAARQQATRNKIMTRSEPKCLTQAYETNIFSVELGLYICSKIFI